MTDFKRIEKEYQAKYEQIKKDFPDYENRSLIELFARMNLTDDEILYLSILEIEEEDQNEVWEGFPAAMPDEKKVLIEDRFKDFKEQISKKKREASL